MLSKEAKHKGPMTYDSIYTECPEQENPHGQTADLVLTEPGNEDELRWQLKIQVSFWHEENALKLEVTVE